MQREIFNRMFEEFIKCFRPFKRRPWCWCGPRWTLVWHPCHRESVRRIIISNCQILSLHSLFFIFIKARLRAQDKKKKKRRVAVDKVAWVCVVMVGPVSYLWAIRAARRSVCTRLLVLQAVLRPAGPPGSSGLPAGPSARLHSGRGAN